MARSPSIRLRLSDGHARAVEFTAQDAASLVVGARRALEGFGSESLELQIRPVSDFLGWLVPMRAGTPVRVYVSRAMLDSRPPDDWTDIWEWIVTTRQQDRAISELAHDQLDDEADRD